MAENKSVMWVINWMDELFDGLKEAKSKEESDTIIGDAGVMFNTLMPKDKQAAFFYLLGKVERDSAD